MSAAALKRVRGISTWIVVLTAIVGVFGVLSALVTRGLTDEAEDFIRDRIDEDEFIEAYAPALLLQFVSGAAMIALVVLTMIWMYRMASNHRALQRNGTWGPGWAIGGWFLPPAVLYIIPFLMFRELWKASDPAVPPGDERWRQNAVSPVVTLWWVLYGLALPISQGIAGFSADMFAADTETLAESIDEQATVTIVSSFIQAAAAVAYIVLVRQLSARHRQLTGE
jgi:hypothetical protein